MVWPGAVYGGRYRLYYFGYRDRAAFGWSGDNDHELTMEISNEGKYEGKVGIGYKYTKENKEHTFLLYK